MTSTPPTATTTGTRFLPAVALPPADPASQQRRRVLASLMMVFAATHAVGLVAVVDAFADPHTAGVILLLRSAPSFIIGWVTGFAADYHRTNVLTWVMLIGAVAMAFTPVTASVMIAGLVMAWSEVSLGALLAEQKSLNGNTTSVAVGFGFDIAKLASAGLAALLAFTIGSWLVAAVAAAGVWLMRGAYRHRPTSDTQPFRWKSNVVIPTIMVTLLGLGAGSLLWVQGAANPTSHEFLVASAVFAVGALAGNGTLLLIASRLGYVSSAIGVTVMGGCCTWAALTAAPAGGTLWWIWGVYGWGAAVAFQSARAITLRDATGRDNALFATSNRLAVAIGGLLLSAVIPWHWWVTVLTAVACVIVLGYGAVLDKRNHSPRPASQ